MKTLCITCPEQPDRMEAAKKHFAEHNVNAEFIYGIHGETFGILSYRPYRRDYPESGALIPISQVGLCLSHYMVWTVCSFLPDGMFMILEDDAQFSEGWEVRLVKALRDAPDFDMLMIGNSNCSDKPTALINGAVFEVKYPFCTHAYIVHRRALPTLLEFARDASMKVDIVLITKVYPKLKVYSVLPRIVGQRGTELVP